MSDILSNVKPGNIVISLSINDYNEIIQCVARINKHREEVRSKWRASHMNSKRIRDRDYRVKIDILNPEVLHEDPDKISLNVIGKEYDRGSTYIIKPLSLMIG